MVRVYKVVYENRRKELVSVWVGQRVVPIWKRIGKRVSPILLKKYSVKEWTTASPSMLKLGYGLCVFPDAFRAVKFRGAHFSGMKGVQIWEAETSELFNPPHFQLHLDYKEFLAKVKAAYSGFPEGTMMCNRVRLIKEVPK